MSKESYIYPTQEAGKAFYMKQLKGEVTMLNLLKFKEVADYSSAPELAPSEPVSGKEAYDLYVKHTIPFLKEAGSEVIFSGTADSFLIGPQDEEWDLVLLVKHASAERFLAFAANEDYLKIAGHRTAALEDSRLLPIVNS